MMEQDIVYCHKQLQKYIRMVEEDESDEEALKLLEASFIKLFDMIKMIMISKQERYYGLFLMNFELRIEFGAYYDAAVSLEAYPFCMEINPLLLGKRPLREMIYILCHEIEHIVLNHPAETLRCNPQKNPTVRLRLNLAMDASINDRLSLDSTENNFAVISEPSGAVTSEFLREFFKLHVKSQQAFDYYYKRIQQEEVPAGSKLEFVFVEQGHDKIVTESKRGDKICIPSWTSCEDPDEISDIIRKFVSDVCEAMPEAMESRLPEHQRLALKKMLTPPAITWKQLLKRYIGTVPDGHRKTRTRLSRRQPERYDISGQIKDRIIKLIVAIDTSGSMSEEALEHIMVEIFSIIGTRMCDVTIIECDAEIKRAYKARSVNDVSYEIMGGGGTSYIPVIEYINSNRNFRDAILVYFTDGMGDLNVPRPLCRRILWVLHDEHCQLSVEEPYGEVVCMQ